VAIIPVKPPSAGLPLKLVNAGYVQHFMAFCVECKTEWAWRGYWLKFSQFLIDLGCAWS